MSVGVWLITKLLGLGRRIKSGIEWLFEEPVRALIAALVLVVIVQRFVIADARSDRDDERKARQAAEQTIANYKAAAIEAKRLEDLRNNRVAKEQAAISLERTNSYEARIADARARAERLRIQLAQATRGTAGAASLSATGEGPAGAPEAPREDGLPPASAIVPELSLTEREIATEQAIQLDELITWVEQQQLVQVNDAPPAGPQ